jgi:biotin transport system substrate-specific component
MQKALYPTLAETSPVIQSGIWTKTAFQVILGSLFLGLSAQISVPLPFTPVNMTMQTLAVFILSMTLGSKKSFFAVVLYLMQASYGLPVMQGGAINPLWFMGPRVGYLLGFAFAAYATGSLLEKRSGFFWTLFSILVGQTLILGLGTLGLGLFVGYDKAFALGTLPFLYGDAIKVSLALSFSQAYKWAHSLTKSGLSG